MTLRHKTRFNTSGQGFKKDPIRYQALIANKVFFKKPCPEVLKRVL